MAMTPAAHAGAQATTAAQAQAAPSDAQASDQTQSDIQDIVVTATHQPTNQQSTPIAITAVTSDQLQERGLKSTADLSAIVPNATFRRAQGAFGPGVTAFIRGIGQADTSLGSEPAVAYYVDDVYYPLLLGSNFDLLDLDHIEVLRGPQGTLFGRNALAGAINIVSKQPSLTKASGYAEVTVGDYNRHDFRAGFSLPLNHMLAIQIGAVSKKRDGYQRVLDFRCEMERRGTPALAGSLPYSSAINTSASNSAPTDCTIGHQGGEDVRAIRGAILFAPADNIRLTVSADYTHDQSENPADQLLSVTGPGSANFQAEAAYFGVAYDSRFVTGNPYTTYATYSDPVGSGVVVPGSTFHNGRSNRGGANFSPNTDLENRGVSGRLVVGLTNRIDLTAVVGYRNLTEHHAFDIDASPLVLEHTLLNIGEHYTNAELRLSGKSRLIDWVAGGFYFEGSGFTHAIIYSPQTGAYKIQNIIYKPVSKAVFANVTVKPLSGLDITLGGRYSDDSKPVDFSNVLDTNAGTSSHVGDTIFQVNPNAKRFDWKAGADYHLTDHVMVYASAATGARLPGYNTRPQQPSQVSSYAGDETLAYELGFKTDLFDRKLRINATAFYTDYKTRITSVTGAEPNLLTGAVVAGNQTVVSLPAGGAGATTCRTYNAATDGVANLANGVGVTCIPRTYFVNTPGKVKGFEIEAEANPLPGLLINGSIGYSKFTSPDLSAATRANDRLAGIPEINASAGIQYSLPVESLGGKITPRLDWSYTGSIDPSAARNTFNQPAYSLFNARLTYYNEDHDVTLAFGVTNLFNKLYYQNFFIYQDIGYPGNNGQPGAPRQWSVEIGKKF
ncbi:TonB-dependent receptor [Sphingomonas sp. RT2P30]|uniref:TonB-dependent receptor n=1 Tax=Parasphingomonas halimpatiens TaxID=3096162 RepID=UPI002FC86A58